ncbi:MAG: hypothetical protein AB1757_27110 [Acidobacteriota bacterium]
MKKISLWSLFILLGVPVLIGAFQANQAQNASSDVLERTVTASQSEYSTTLASFMESLLSARVPGGIVTILHCDNNLPIRHTSLSSGTLREAMNTIVNANPEYRWQINDGVINLLPVQDEPSLLNVRISKLKVKDARSIETIRSNLFELPEVKEAIAKLQLTPGVKFIVGPIPLDPERRPKYSLECENVTVREALNAIVRAHGRAAWEYKEQRCDDKTIYNVNFVIE